MCADGCKQREYTDKVKAASPTPIMESIFITTAIDTKENWDVAIIDMPETFLHVDNDETVVMFMKGKMAELMVHVAPYRKYITATKQGEKILNMKVQKALYGMLKSALLFYERIRENLEKNGFKVNPYDPHIENKEVNGSQMTIIWHMDDLKVSHKDPWEITKMTILLSKIYVNIKVQCGKKLEYHGMDIGYTVPGEVKISMIPYIENILKDFPEKIVGTATTPAGEHLFEVREGINSTKLPESQSITFPHNVAKLLFYVTMPGMIYKHQLHSLQ